MRRVDCVAAWTKTPPRVYMQRLRVLERQVATRPVMLQLPHAPSAAVVALESTIITHGMPFPQNLETARAVEV
ncbi:hypothetical protein T492DRAFT_891246 [Pavlovales sp. CCMP2436]|nr:hypothetical protein T492DRAFT_891246 [Pavlovales sp. CCMP2436]